MSNTPEGAPSPHHATFTLVSPEETFRIDEFSFETEKKRIPSIGDILLAGVRIGDQDERTLTRIGVAMKDGKITKADAEEMEREDNDLYSLQIEMFPGSREALGYEWMCHLYIAGTAEHYKSPIRSDDLKTETSIASTNIIWNSNNSSDDTEYEIMISPHNIDFLTKLSFAVSLERVNQE